MNISLTKEAINILLKNLFIKNISPDREKYNKHSTKTIDKGTDLTKLEYQSIDEWDSIGHMTLMSELEDNFDITLTEDLIQFESYTQGTEILERYSIKFNKMLIEKPLVVDNLDLLRDISKNNRQIGTKQRV